MQHLAGSGLPETSKPVPLPQQTIGHALGPEAKYRKLYSSFQQSRFVQYIPLAESRASLAEEYIGHPPRGRCVLDLLHSPHESFASCRILIVSDMYKQRGKIAGSTPLAPEHFRP